MAHLALPHRDLCRKRTKKSKIVIPTQVRSLKIYENSGEIQKVL